jgi:DNA recombination protein Rad52
MAFSKEQIAALESKLDPVHVAQRKQGFSQVHYIEGWHAIAEANRIFGFDGWTRETVYLERVCQYERKIGKEQKDGWSVTYIAKVRITAHGVVREGSGSGHGIGTDLGEAHESAIKEAETDAMKRALMTFGNPFGLALYDKSRVNVGVDEPPPQTITSEEAIALDERIKALGADRAVLLKHYGIDGPHQLTPLQLASAHASLDKKEAAKQKESA